MSDIVKRLRAWAMDARLGKKLLGADQDLDEAAAAIEAQRAEIARLRGENAALQKMARTSERWYWPEEDTSSDTCRDCPAEVFEDGSPGEVHAYACGGVSRIGYFGWLPPADDSDSDDNFEVDEPTLEAAEAKLNAEIERRAALKVSP